MSRGWFEDHISIAAMDVGCLADVDGQDLRTTCLVLADLVRLGLNEF